VSYARARPLLWHDWGWLMYVVAYRDGSGTITFDEFKGVFSAEIGPDAIPFNFDWCVLVGLRESWI